MARDRNVRSGERAQSGSCPVGRRRDQVDHGPMAQIAGMR